MKRRLTALAVATVATVGFSANAVLAQSMVVRATGPSASSYPQGTKLAADRMIELKNNDIVTVLDKAGTRILRGPGTFTLDGSVNADNNVFANLSRSLKGTQPVRAGAVRGGNSPGVGDEMLSPSIWYVDMRSGGRVCAPADGKLILWRQDAQQGEFVWLGQKAGGLMQRLYWGPGTPGIVWPTAVAPMANGETYILAGEGSVSTEEEDRTLNVNLVVLEDVPENPADLAQLLLQNQCIDQFDYLVARMGGTDETEES